MANLLKQQLLSLRGELRVAESMAEHVSWRAGGVADYFFQPADCEDLAQLLSSLPADTPLFWLGLGSNSLVRDGGIRGVVISTQKTLNALTPIDDFTLRAEAGVSCATLARFGARLNLAGVEFLAGVPGTIGGALAMNAGCHGGETWDHVAAVETIDRQGQFHLRKPEDFSVGYRSVEGPAGEWFVAGHFRLERGEKARSLEVIRTLLERRAATQPTSEPNGGSVFRNPPGDYAARLIEVCGLKGMCIGGACVSEKHANFIVNTGNATATDIENLIEWVANKVASTHGVHLIQEVRIVGEGIK